MGRRQYNSAADRRWQQRYQRIQERKDSAPDTGTARDERRREKRTLYKTSQIDIERMSPNKTAVLCISPIQVRQLYYAVSRWRPEYTKWGSVEWLEERFYYCSDATVGIITDNDLFFETTEIRIDSKRYFIAKGFEIIDFCELLPVKDLGEVRVGPESVEFLLGI